MRYYEQDRPSIDLFREEYEFLSNFYHAKLEYEGLAYYSAEAAYQAQKCKDPRDRLLFCGMYADEAKRFGRKVEMREDWDEVKISVMEKVVSAKFSQNPLLARRLLETGEKPLLEGNHWHDLFWGVDHKTGEGENHLGKILMGLREKYRREGLPEAASHPVRQYGPLEGITVTDEDITQLDVTCIVNAANPTLLGGNGLDGAIHREAGEGLLEECRTLNGCQTGEAKLTGGYNLKARYIIHTVGPIYGKEEPSLLKTCYLSCLDLAKEHGIHSIAFPAISTGKYCFPKEKAMEIAVKTVNGWLKAHGQYQMDVVFSCVDQRIYQYACHWLNVISGL